MKKCPECDNIIPHHYNYSTEHGKFCNEHCSTLFAVKNKEEKCNTIKHSFTIPRIPTGNKELIISFNHFTKIDIKDTLVIVQKVITDWINNTKQGKDAWIYSCDDFNIGDLASHTTNDYLIAAFKKEGISDFTIKDEYPKSNTDIWHFDTILIDINSLQENF